jgi:hypothetical protein
MLKPIASLTLGLTLSLNTLVLSGCKEKTTYVPKKTGSDVSVVASNVADGLDLSQLPALVRQAKDGEDLEKLLNSSGVNNLDTNQDGNVDYLNVEEFRENGQQGFVLFTNENGQRSDIAQVSVTRNGQNGEVAVQGNPNYYPQQTVYRSSFPWGEILLAAWLINLARPRYYHPPYYYGFYPRSYRSYRVMPVASYRTRLSSSGYRTRFGSTRPISTGRINSGFGFSKFGRTSTFNTGRVTNTTRGGMNQSRNSLANTNGSSFGVTNNKRPGGSGSGASGFGSSSSRSRSRSTTFGGNSSNSSFGGSSSGRNSYSGPSFGSSSNRSRSSSFGGFGSSSSRSSSFGSSSRSSSFGGSSSRRRR